MLQIKKQELYNEDCLKTLSSFLDKSIDIIITSPPYNIKKDYGTYKDNLPWDEYLNWLKIVCNELFRVLKDDGSFFLNIGSTNINPTMSFDICCEISKIFKLQNSILWVKSITLDDNSYGHFKPIKSNRFLNNTHENIFHFSKEANVQIDRLSIGVPFKDKSNINRWQHGKDVRCRGNTWYIPYKTVQSKTDKFHHPATFPLELPTNCIKLHGINENTKILDPFAGVGTTNIAAQLLGVNGIGIELDKNFFDIAVSRLENLP